MPVTAVKNTFFHIEAAAEFRKRSNSAPDLICSSTGLQSDCGSISSKDSALFNGCAQERAITNTVETPETRTTVMIQNIPCKYTRRQMLDEVAALDLECDKLHLPRAKTGGNLGYCFVNFTTPEGAQAFIELFSGREFMFQKVNEKRATVIYAKNQGLEQKRNSRKSA